ncbi:MAG TPA: toll/interleukin-1 receptor domain-containing protein [Sphingomicrobium sp.]|nr:toll/interleukin-1 receptor domain-containing protein [Sphingomicrobium sp.]
MTSEALNSGCFFLSYSRSDERIALQLAKDLRASGVAMWVDQLDIRPSEHWDRAIERAVSSCRGLIVILSPRSVASDNVADEISFAIDNGKSVLPVMIERCTLPLRLTRMQVVDATGNYARALKQCLDELTRRSEPAETKPGAQASRPHLDSDEIAKARQHLSAILGPIAGRLVDKAAVRAGSTSDLYGILALHIDNQAERARFLEFGSVPLAAQPPVRAEPAGPERARAPSIDAAEIESMTRLMANYIGPIAAILVKRASGAVENPDQLREQLASHIPDERQRAKFLREAQAQ